MAAFLDRETLMAHYMEQMPEPERQAYRQSGDLSIVRVFHGKLFVIYNLLRKGDSPNILSILRVTDISIQNQNLMLEVLDLKLGKVYQLDYVPRLLCGYDIFASVPSECMVSKVLKKTQNGHVIDAGLTAGILLKHRMKPEFKMPGYVYCAGLSDFYHLFGDAGRRAFEKLEYQAQGVTNAE